MDAAQGPEDCFNPRGWFWNGDVCEQIICTCEGTDCNALYPDEIGCTAAYLPCLSGGECAPFDAKAIGDCDAFLGYTWTGDNCIGISGCECSGTDCVNLYDSSEECWDEHALCELTDPCGPDEAKGEGPCDQFFGWAWDGLQCIGVSGCECIGPDCGSLPLELGDCEIAHADCPVVPPPDGCQLYKEDECMLHLQCMAIEGDELLPLGDGYCADKSKFLGCGDSVPCLAVLTWGCGPNDEVAQFPSACLPPGWVQCDPPIVDPPPCP